MPPTVSDESHRPSRERNDLNPRDIGALPGNVKGYFGDCYGDTPG